MAKRALVQDKNKNTITRYYHSKSTQNKRKQQLSLSNQKRTGLFVNKHIILKPKISKQEQIKKYKLNTLLCQQQHVKLLIQKSKPLIDFLQKMQICIGESFPHILIKFLQNQKYKPWTEKYQPKLLNQMINNSSINKVIKWTQAKVSSKRHQQKQDTSSKNSLFLQKQQLQKIIQQQQWKLKALIIKGQQGIGKQTIVRCLTKQFKIRISQCSNQIDIHSYFKQNYQSIKSHSFIKQQRVQQIQASANKFKNYFKDSKQLCGKLHLISDINLVYPQEKKPKFYENIVNFVKQSSVPIILTCVGRIPKVFYSKQFDIVELQYMKVSDIAKHIWCIIHCQFHLNLLYKNDLIKKDQLQQTFIRYFEKLEFQQLLTLEEVTTIVNKIGCRIDHILLFFQRYFLINYSKNIMLYDDIIQILNNQKKQDIFIQKQQSLLLHSIQQETKDKFISISMKSPMQSLNKDNVDYLLSTAEKQSITSNNSIIKNQDLLFTRLIQIQKQTKTRKQISSKISLKTGYKFKSSQIEYLKLMETKKDIRLRKNKIESSVKFKETLKQFLSSQELQYILNMIA